MSQKTNKYETERKNKENEKVEKEYSNTKKYFK